MNLPKHWHIAELKGKERIPHSDYTSKTKLIRAFIYTILNGRDEFIIKVPNWKTFIIYKSDEPRAKTIRDGTPNEHCETCAIFPLECDGKRHECGQREGKGLDKIVYKSTKQGGKNGQ